MSAHPAPERLHDLVDGRLSNDETRDVARHLETCEACRDEVEAIRLLLLRLERLPREVAPPSRIWPQVASRTVERPHPRGIRWIPAVAAAGLVLIAGLWIGGAFRRPIHAPLPPPSPGAEAAARPAEVIAGLQAESARATDHLLAVFQARRDRLPPDVAAAFEESDRSVARAIAEVERALDRHPDDRRLAERAARTIRQRIALLERAVRMASRPL